MRRTAIQFGFLTMMSSTGLWGDAAVLKGHTRDVHAVACAASGDVVVSGGEEGSVIVWNAASRQKTGEFKGDAALAVALSPDGKRLAAGERYKKVRLLEASGKEIKTLEGHEGSVIAVQFTADSRTLISVAKDGGIRIWDAGTGAPQGAAQKILDSLDSAAVSVDGKSVVGGAGGFVYLQNLGLKKLAWKTAVPANAKAVAVSADGRMVAAALGNNTVVLLDAASGKELRKAEGVDGNGLAFSADGAKLAVAGHDNDVHVLEVAGMKGAAKWKGHERTVRSVCFWGERVVSGSFDMTIRVAEAR